ncbi:MAG: hypothetical protein KDD42_07400 [Bdellovibrionales bacterium]|nr:hypothetical protein [Bdellovibrionales bacterium]
MLESGFANIDPTRLGYSHLKQLGAQDIVSTDPVGKLPAFYSGRTDQSVYFGYRLSRQLLPYDDQLCNAVIKDLWKYPTIAGVPDAKVFQEIDGSHRDEQFLRVELSGNLPGGDFSARASELAKVLKKIFEDLPALVSAIIDSDLWNDLGIEENLHLTNLDESLSNARISLPSETSVGKRPLIESPTHFAVSLTTSLPIDSTGTRSAKQLINWFGFDSTILRSQNSEDASNILNIIGDFDAQQKNRFVRNLIWLSSKRSHELGLKQES